MKKFKFRLEKVLEYRTLVEQWAKEAFLEARLSTFECEGKIADIRAQRRELLTQPVGTIQEHLAIESMLQKSDDDERAQLTVLAVLKDEEDAAMEEWKLKRQELKALQRLKDEALSVWQHDSNVAEQNELDEWATTRKAS